MAAPPKQWRHTQVLGLMTLGLVALVPLSAWGTCPSLGDYTQAGHTPYQLVFRPTDRLPPPNITMPGGCGDATPPSWCADVVASIPNPVNGEALREHLFVWFPGKNLRPDETDYVPKLAAFAGYRAINLPWDNAGLTRTDWCARDGLDGGYCDDGCLFSTGQEMLDGIDVDQGPQAEQDYEAHPLRGITTRLAMALEYLHKRAIQLDGNDDVYHWTAYCDYDQNAGVTSIDWANTEVGGFSMGGGMASFVSYVAPDVTTTTDTLGLLTIDGGADTCEWPGVALANQNTDYYPDEYDDPSIAPCGPGGPCSDHNRYLFTHTTGVVNISLAYGDTALVQVGIDDTTTNVDALIAGSFPIDFENAAGDFPNLLVTDMGLGTCDAHGSLGEDVCMPSTLSAPFSAASHPADAYLAPAFLSALCVLDAQ